MAMFDALIQATNDRLVIRLWDGTGLEIISGSIVDISSTGDYSH